MNSCRGCMEKEADVFLSLFSTLENLSIEHMFQTLTGIMVSRDDGLPRYICLECAGALLTFYKLRKQFLQSNEYFRSLAGDAANTAWEGVLEENAESSNELDEDCAKQITCTKLDVEKHYSECNSEHDESTLMQNKRYEEGKNDDHVLAISSIEDNENEIFSVEYMPIDCDESEENNGESRNEVNEDFQILCCSCPGLQFTNSEDLDQHSEAVHAKVRGHSDVRPYECNVCYKRFLDPIGLEKHQQMPYRTKPFKCTELGCTAEFLGRSAFLSHKKSKHSNERAYVCDVCQKAFFTSSTLLSHRKIHAEKQFQCKVCMKKFYRKADMLTHQISHQHERPYGCQQCDKRFKSRNHLRLHQNVHTKQRMQCGLCDASFTTYMDRRVHQLSHENIDLFKCSYCEKVFSRNYKLQLHIRKLHTLEQPYECKKCSLKFFQNWELTAHLRDQHGSTSSESSVEAFVTKGQVSG